jgi:sialate O-acetylesterase
VGPGRSGCARVTLALGRVNATATADAGGVWSARLDTGKVKATGDLDLTVTAGSERVVVHAVALGEVWVASGQSNMYFPLINGNKARFPDPTLRVANAEAEVAAARFPQIRWFMEGM